MAIKQLSPKNKYQIDKERQYELEHFCKQYPNWVIDRRDCLSGRDIGLKGGYLTVLKKCTKDNKVDRTAALALYSYELEDKIHMVDDCLDIAVAANIKDELPKEFEDLKKALFCNITSGVSYDSYFVYDKFPPVSKQKFYHIRRVFFWLLDQKRG